jgi:hypothetical protein
MSYSQMKPHEKNFKYANFCQSLHIGCNHYKGLKSESKREVYESYNDVNKYEKFFKDELYFDSV